MRGYIYEVTTEINNVGFMDESDFYSLVGVEADYFEDAEYEDDKVKDYLESWEKYGAETGMEEKDDGKEIPWIIFNRNARRNFFKKRFDEMKAVAESITLDEFSTDKVSTLKSLIIDNYSNAVYFNSCFYPEDDFIRLAEAGRKYYIVHVDYMG